MINIGTLLATLKLDDRLTPVLAKASANLQSAGTKLKALGGSMQATGSTMTMGLTAPIVGMGAAVAVAFGSFEKSMNRVRALTGATGQDFDALKAQAKELGKTTSFSASEAADAMGFLAMAGFKTSEVIGAMPGVLELAAAAQMDLASAADITSNIMTGYGQTTEDLARTNNILVQAMTTANVDLRMLGESMKYVGPVAKSAGVSFEEATATIALFGNAGIQGSMAGTALRGAISKLLNPTSKAAKEMRTLGINALDTEGNLRPMSDIVQQLGERGTTTAQMMTIFGLRAGPAMAGLVEQGHEALRKMTGSLEDVGNVAQRIKDIQLEGLSGAFVRFKSAANGAMIEMGEQLAPAFERILKIGIKVSNWVSGTLVPAFAALSPATQAIIIGFVGFLAALGPILMVAGTLVSVIGSLMTALSGVAVGAALVTLGWVALAAAVVILLLKFKPTRDILIAIATILKNLVVGAIRETVKKFKDLWKGTKALVGTAIEFITKFQFVADAIGWVGEKAKWLIGGLQNVAEATSRWGETAHDVAQRKMKVLQDRVEDLTNALGEKGLGDTVEALEANMIELGNAGGLTEEVLGAFADQARVLESEGQTLSAGLLRVRDAFALEEEVIAQVNEQLENNLDATEEVSDAVSGLRDELSGANLLKDLANLQAAWSELTPEQQASERAMELAGEMAASLRDELGADALTGDLIGLADAADLAAISVEDVGTKMSDTAQKAKRMAEEFSGKNLRKEVDALSMSLGNLVFMEEDTQTALSQVGEAALKLRNDGAGLGGELNRLADLFVAAQSAANDFVGPPELPKQATLAKKLGDAWEQIPGIMVDALKGGGDAMKAIGSLFGSTVGSHFGNKLKGSIEGLTGKIGGTLGSLLGPLGGMAGELLAQGITAVAGKVSGAIAGLFGRDTADNAKITASKMWGIVLNDTAADAAATMAQKMGDDFAGLLMSLGTIMEQGGGVMALGFEKVTKAARDTFSGIDMGKINAQQALEGLTPVLGALAEDFDKAGEAGQTQFLELITLAEKFGLDMNAIVEIVGEDLVNQALGKDLPSVMGTMREELQALKVEGLDPFVARLVDLGVITNDDLTAINALMHGSQVDFQAMEAAANKYGIELSDLGPKFDEARLNEIAANISADFEMLTANGANVNAVIAGMGDEVQNLVTDALQAGVAIPANMRPIITQMVEMGTLVGENGVAITDMSDLNFAEPMVVKFEKVVDKLGDVITAFIKAMTAADNVKKSVEDIPDTVTVGIGFAVAAVPAFNIPSHIRVGIQPEWNAMENFLHGTGGAFQDFGAGTPVVLHGRERITPIGEASGDALGIAVLEKRLVSIERLLRDQPRAFGLAISDSLTLIN